LEDLPVLSYRRFSPLLIWFFYLLLILGPYVVHWIGLSLSFSKSPSLLKTESVRKSYDRFHLPIFPVGANPVAPGFSPRGRFWAGGARLYIGRSGAQPGGAGEVGFYAGSGPRPPPEHQTGWGPVPVPGGPAQSPARPTFDRFLPKICPQRPYFNFL
jgi:hypothetical protein